MPKTASKRARARQSARVTRAHQTVGQRPITRRIPAARGRKRPTGVWGLINQYPWATTIFTALLVGGIVLLLRQQRVWPFSPAAPKTPAQATCNLKTHACNHAPLMTIDKHKLYVATIKTNRGNIVIRMDPNAAPITVNNFVFLAQQHFYDGLTFHRVLHSAGQQSGLDIIQGGDPKGDGTGGPGYKFKDEPVVGNYIAGAVAMANSGANTNGSQFFICTADDTTKLGKSYNLFGQVIQGLNVAQAIVKGDKMISVTIAVENPTPTATGGAASTATPAK
ncbi:MAG TPA: peptidylprolyl isomerase [Ktedonobacterales bacterium]|jgi:cyclophilin family peptidyl-prolyl cis-trans isomerase